jgi:hypothetical protein
VETGIAPSVIYEQVPVTEIIPLLRTALGVKAQNELRIIAGTRGDAKSVNKLADGLRKEIGFLSDPEGKKTTKASWHNSIRALAGLSGNKKVARQARIRERHERFLRRKEQQNGQN